MTNTKPPSIRNATILLASIRAVLACLCAYVGFVWAGEDAFFAAAWYAVPAVFIALGFRWILWITIAMNAVTVGFGLVTLPGFGHLHGGEIFTYAAIPAVVEIVLAVNLIRAYRKILPTAA